MEILNALKERRESLKVTQEALAELSGVSLRTIKQCESGKGNPTIKTVINLSDILGLEVHLKVKKV